MHGNEASNGEEKKRRKNMSKVEEKKKENTFWNLTPILLLEICTLDKAWLKSAIAMRASKVIQLSV